VTEEVNESAGKADILSRRHVSLASSVTAQIFTSLYILESIESSAENLHLSHSFVGLVMISLILSSVEHITTAIRSHKEGLAWVTGLDFGSCIRIALFVFPVAVLIGWMADIPGVTMIFDGFQVTILALTIFAGQSRDSESIAALVSCFQAIVMDRLTLAQDRGHASDIVFSSIHDRSLALSQPRVSYACMNWLRLQSQLPHSVKWSLDVSFVVDPCGDGVNVLAVYYSSLVGNGKTDAPHFYNFCYSFEDHGLSMVSRHGLADKALASTYPIWS
jgi:hypothetical protein